MVVVKPAVVQMAGASFFFVPVNPGTKQGAGDGMGEADGTGEALGSTLALGSGEGVGSATVMGNDFDCAPQPSTVRVTV